MSRLVDVSVTSIVSIPSKSIPTILRMRCFAQIFDAVIPRLAIDVINDALWGATVEECPNDPMGRIVPALKTCREIFSAFLNMRC